MVKSASLGAVVDEWKPTDFHAMDFPASDSPMDIARFVDSRVAEGHRALKQHMDRRFADIDRALGETRECILRGFPNGDLDSHRIYHSEIMREIDRERRLRSSVVANVIGWAVIGLLTAVVTGVGLYAAHFIRGIK